MAKPYHNLQVRARRRSTAAAWSSFLARPLRTLAFDSSMLACFTVADAAALLFFVDVNGLMPFAARVAAAFLAAADAAALTGFFAAAEAAGGWRIRCASLVSALAWRRSRFA